MKTYHTHQLEPTHLRTQEKEWVYNGLDACITAEVLDVLLPQLDDAASQTYEFSRALQGPVLEMRLRGVLVDQQRKADVIQEYRGLLNTLEHSLNQMVGEAYDLWEFNYKSPVQLQELFYDKIGIPAIRRKGRVTVDRATLEKLESYILARPAVGHIKAMRELAKKVSVLNTEIDSDGRIRTSYNIAGTSTGRFSSSFSEFGTGGNLQNVEEMLRSVLIADPGMKMGYFDAEQIQSRIVGAIEWDLFGDGRYLDACETGDLHTHVAKLCHPEWKWPNNPKGDRELAETPYYRHFDLRKLCKSIGHGTNFGGKPPTLHRMYKVPLEAIEDFQPRYFAAFPAHQLWHAWVEHQIKTTGTIYTICGNKRQFWGRRDSPDTVREAIAYDPQNSEAWIVNHGMLNIWRAGSCQLLMQNHDAVVVQFPEEQEDEIVPEILKQLRFPVELNNGRELVIPYGAKTGWNFGPYDARTNVDGLKTYKAGDSRKRTPKLSILDRPIYKSYKRA